jgi:phosphinothricin acetyltransferase
LPEALIRPGVLADLPPLTEIYNHYIRETAITFDLEPFTPEERRGWFDQFSSDGGAHRLLVGVQAGRVIGHACSHRFRPKGAYRTSVETSIYLAPDATGAGHGSRLYGALFEALAQSDLHRAYAGVTLPNEASIRLHTRFGFRSIGIYREVGFKFGRFWDVHWFEKDLG